MRLGQTNNENFDIYGPCHDVIIKTLLSAEKPIVD